ncbi:MAG: hypothetical protein QXT63_02050, partial [Thermoplasmata archaeon]
MKDAIKIEVMDRGRCKMDIAKIIIGISDEESNAQIIQLNRYRRYTFITMLIAMLFLSLYFIFTEGKISPFVLPLDHVLLSIFGILLGIVAVRFAFNYAEIQAYEGDYRKDAYSRFFTRAIGWVIASIVILALALYPIYSPTFYKEPHFFAHKIDTATSTEPIEVRLVYSDNTRLIVIDHVFIEIYDGADISLELWKSSDFKNTSRKPVLTSNVSETKTIKMNELAKNDYVLLIYTKGTSSEVSIDVHKVFEPVFYYLSLTYCIIFLILSIFWCWRTRKGEPIDAIIEIPTEEKTVNTSNLNYNENLPSGEMNNQTANQTKIQTNIYDEQPSHQPSRPSLQSNNSFEPQYTENDRLFSSGIFISKGIDEKSNTTYEDIRHTEPERHREVFVKENKSNKNQMFTEKTDEQTDDERLRIERELREKLAREEMRRRELEKMLLLKEQSTIEDIFLIHSDGRLICHNTRRLKPELDGDILTGMLTAVQSFVKDTLNTQTKGNLNELKYGDLKILIEYGQYAYIAVVVSGEPPKTLRPRMKEILKILHVKYYHTLPQWDGNVAKVRDAKEILKALFTGVLPRELILKKSLI